MDYAEFKTRVDKYVVLFDPKSELVSGVDTIHFSILVHPQSDNTRRLMDEFCEMIWLIEERGAVFKEDFIVSAVRREDEGIFAILHIKDKFASDEDFDPTYRRYGEKRD